MNNTKFLAGIAHELKFWKGFVQTERFLDGWVAKEKTPELNEKVYNIITGFTQNLLHKKAMGMVSNYPKILDVGSGVVSILNGTVPSQCLVASDPLGELYETVFDYAHHGMIRPEPLPAEEFIYQNEFDIVHMSNALDHTQDPILVLSNLRRALKKGGLLIIQGFENEGTFENWQGFHQWDISLDLSKENLLIKNKEGGVIAYSSKVSNMQVVCGEVTKTENGKNWYLWILEN